MAWSRADFLSEARRQAEKEDDLDRYPELSLKRLFGVVHRSEWRKMLEIAPRYRVVESVIVSSGFTVDELTICGGLIDASVHRVLSVSISGQELPEDVDSGPTLHYTSPMPPPRWRWENESLKLRGLPFSGVTMSVRASVLPPPPPVSADDEITVDWPDEFAFVLVYEMAGRMLTKGSVESAEAADQFRMADAERQNMVRVLRRKGMLPEMLRPNDDASDWTVT